MRPGTGGAPTPGSRARRSPAGLEPKGRRSPRGLNATGIDNVNGAAKSRAQEGRGGGGATVWGRAPAAAP